MTGKLAEKKDFVSVKEILDGLDSGLFWLPHFQRGSVWNEEMDLRLLDSLLLGTPCGSLVSWTPNAADPQMYGVPITRAVAGKIAEYLVDGQQRVRALLRCRMALDSGGSQREQGVGSADIWAYLPNTPEFKGASDPAKLRGRRDGVFFRDVVPEPGTRLRNPFVRGAGGASVRAADLQRLAVLSSEKQPAEANRLAKMFLHGLGLPEEAHIGLLLDVAQSVYRMRERSFFVSRLGDDTDLHGAVEIYNRINSSGLRVDSAERALATLTGISADSTTRGLRRVLAGLHGEHIAAKQGMALELRDLELQRKREELLGFKFALRMVAQALANEDWGATEAWLSFEHLQREDIADRLSHVELLRTKWKLGGGLDEIWRRCELAARAVKAALQRELGCDDYRRIPRGPYLQPIVQLLVRFPERSAAAEEDQGSRRQLASLILRRMLGELGNSKAERQLLDSIRIAGRWSEGVEILRGFRAKEMKEDLREAFSAERTTVQSRPAQMLYWSLRRRPGGSQARDFDYRANGVLTGQPVRLIDRSADPQCQHMLPVSKVAPRLSPEGSARGAGPVNRLGNLTWISAELNGLDALGDRIVRLEQEDPGNLACHVYDFEVGRRSALDAFLELRSMLEETIPQRSGYSFADKYGKFCLAREQAIQKRFVGWLEELEQQDADGGDLPAAPVLPDPHVHAFEAEVMELINMATDESRRRAMRLLLVISTNVFRIAVSSGHYFFHAHPKHNQFVLQLKRDGSRRWRGTDSVLWIDLDEQELLRGERAEYAELFDAMSHLAGTSYDQGLPLDHLARHEDEVLRLLSASILAN